MISGDYDLDMSGDAIFIDHHGDTMVSYLCFYSVGNINNHEIHLGHLLGILVAYNEI